MIRFSNKGSTLKKFQITCNHPVRLSSSLKRKRNNKFLNECEKNYYNQPSKADIQQLKLSWWVKMNTVLEASKCYVWFEVVGWKKFGWIRNAVKYFNFNTI